MEFLYVIGVQKFRNPNSVALSDIKFEFSIQQKEKVIWKFNMLLKLYAKLNMDTLKTQVSLFV